MDLSTEERSLMEQHGNYFRELFAAGKVLLFGPVLAPPPEGSFGVGVLEVADEAEARQIAENDPTVRAKLNKFAIYPMRVGAARAKS